MHGTIPSVFELVKCKNINLTVNRANRFQADFVDYHGFNDTNSLENQNPVFSTTCYYVEHPIVLTNLRKDRTEHKGEATD